MAQQIINRGSAPNDPSADTHYDAFGKVKNNFNELYGFADNQGKSMFLFFSGNGQLTTAELVDYINFTGQFGNFQISEIQTPVFIKAAKSNGTTLYSYMFAFMGGKGNWGGGVGQTPVTEELFVKWPAVIPATVEDIENAANTVTYDLGPIVFSNFLTLANEEEHDFTDEDNVYFFTYTIGGVGYTQQFIGEPGVYGDGNTPFTAEDFAAGPNTNTPQVITVQAAADADNTTTTPIVFADDAIESKLEQNGAGSRYFKEDFIVTEKYENPVASVEYKIPAKPHDDTYMMLSDREYDLPEDFFISCVQSSMGITEVGEGTKIMYITDQQRYLLLEGVYAPVMTGACFSVIVEGNKVYILYHIDYLEGYRQYGLLSLDCRIFKNILTPISFQHHLIPADELQTTTSPNVTMHSEAYKDGWLYYATRDTSQPTRFLKVNANNVSEYRIVSSADIGLIDGGGFNNIELWGNYLYFLYTANPHTNDHIGRVDLNFNHYEKIVDLSPDDVRTIPEQNPFIIYHNQIFTYTVDKTNSSTLNNKFRIQAYSLDGELLRESDVIEITPDTTDGIILPHWMTVFNGKMLMHTAQQNSVRKLLIRLDVGYGKTGEDNYVPITLEEYVTIPARGVTDDNTITSYGEIWLNSETSTSFPDERRLFVVDSYLDLSTLHEYNDLNYSSTGTPPTKVEREINYLPVSTAPVSESPKIIKLDPVTTSAVTGTDQAIVASYLITGGTLEDGIFHVISRLQKVGAGGAATYRFYINTSNSLSGASDLAIFTSAANGRDTNFRRTFIVKGDTILGSAKSVSLISDDVAMVTAPTTTSYTVANNYYFIVTVTLAVGTDSVTQEFFEMTFKKQH